MIKKIWAFIKPVDLQKEFINHQKGRLSFENFCALLTKKKRKVNKLFGRGKAVIHEAAKFNRIDVLRSLISLGANVNIVDYQKRTPLYIAASYNNVEIVKILLENGADLFITDQSGYSPLDIANLFQNFEVSQLLTIKVKEFKDKNVLNESL